MAVKEPTEIGKRLRKAREAFGITANALSLQMDPSPGRAWVTQVESGRTTSPGVELLRRAAKVLGIRDEWLLLGTGAMWRRTKRAA